MNEPDEHIDPEEVDATARALGESAEWPEGRQEGEAVEGTARIARLVEEAYEREPEYGLTDAQRQLILGGSTALRAVPALHERNRKSFLIAAASGLAVAACLFFLLALWPAVQEPANQSGGVASADPELEEGVVMRVEILEKPLVAETPNGSDPQPDVPGGEGGPVVVKVEDEGKKDPAPSIVDDPVTPVPVVAKKKSLDDWMRLIASGVEEAGTVFDFEKAVAGIRETSGEGEALPRWRLVDSQSTAELDKSGLMLQRLVFRGPASESPAMLVGLTFDPERVAQFRPVHRNEWTGGGGELVVEIPEEAVERGHWELLLEVEPAPLQPEYYEEGSRDPRMLGSNVTPVVGDVVVAGDTDQAAARIKLNGEMEMSPELRAEMVLARFARWAIAPGEKAPEAVLGELRSLVGEADLEKLILKGF